MLVTLDLDTNTLVYGPGMCSAITSLRLPRGAGTEMRVQTVRKGVIEPLPDTFSMVWTCKAASDWSGAEIAYADDFVETAADSGVYVAAVNYEGEALDALLLIGETGEKAEVVIAGQLAWRSADEEPWQSTQVIDLTVHNSIWRGVSPAPVPGSTPALTLLRLDAPVAVDTGSPYELFEIPVGTNAVYELEIHLLMSSDDGTNALVIATNGVAGTEVWGSFARHQRAQPTGDAFAFDEGGTLFSDDEGDDAQYQVSAKFLVESGSTPGMLDISCSNPGSGTLTVRAHSWVKLHRML